MLIDLSVKVTKFVRQETTQNVKKASFGHLGTHFDVMNKEFPLSFVKREGVVFNVSGIKDRDINLEDIDMSYIKRDMFIAWE